MIDANSIQNFGPSEVGNFHLITFPSPPGNSIGNDGKLRKITVIPFDQYDLTSNLDSDKHKGLLDFVRRFNGLCELVCNRILIDGLLGSGGEDENFIKKHVTVDRMDEEKIKKSHLLDVYSVFQRGLAYLFGIYPNNIFSCFKQWKLVNTTTKEDVKVRLVNREILGDGLAKIRVGETLKFQVFKKENYEFSGHSLLIKKMENNGYIFFDPNDGEHRNLSLDKLGDKIDQQLKYHTDIFLLRGADFLKKLKA
ncbi:MAG TPA: hypothetical protein VGP47_00390 [Parachlamydiaceae bacterium]|nr:hypothetical protein [Parachlamydiaceae bacterium]